MMNLILGTPSQKAWEKIGVRPHHGINVPLFSLRSEKNSGIGEFHDLFSLIDWVHEIGFDVIQLLPLNDSGEDSSPYNAISSCALNPIYISLHSLPYLDDDLKRTLRSFSKYKRLQRSPYLSILYAKIDFLRTYFEKCFAHFANDPSYQKYVETTPWLQPYARFKAAQEGTSETDFYSLLQYIAGNQLEEVRKYANQKGVFLKGDIPILISPDSLDVEMHSSDFDLSYSAGAPPDIFTPDGQIWGFPIYRWDVIEKNHFKFWNMRLLAASRFYDLYRIDHIIGFYRIWAIERGKTAIEGAYFPTNPLQRIAQGEKILKTLLNFTDMLPIGEDLGSHIEEIRLSFTKLGIPGTKIPRWERNYGGDLSFIPYDQYTPISLTSVSTHDSETLGEWWEKNPLDAQEFAKFSGVPYESTLTSATRYEILRQSHKSASLFHINLLQEYLDLFPDLSWHSFKEDRINIPGTVIPSNWCYKMRPTLEELVAHAPLKKALQTFLQ